MYHERKDDVVIFLKIKKGRVRIGKLFDFYTRSKKLDTLTVDLGSLEIEKTKDEALGIETGFIFKEVEFDNFEDWQNEYKWLEQTLAMSKSRHKPMNHISLEKYLQLIRSKKDLRKY